jgi:predicted ATPase
VIAVISSLEIQNLRGIHEGKLDELTPLVVLVGPNGSGKSTVLDALLIGTSKDPQQAARDSIKRHRGVEQGARWICWRGVISETVRVTISTESGASRPVTLSFGADGPKIANALAQGHRRNIQRPEDTAGARPRNRAANAIPDVRLVEPRVFDPIPPLHQLYTEAVVEGRRDEVRGIATDLIPHARHLEILTEGDRPIVHLVFDDHSVPVAVAGDGIYSLALLSLELASRPSGVVLIEEPEVHQHPAAIARSVRAILGAIHRGIQIVITTHSLEFIDCLLAEASNGDLEKLSVYRLGLNQGELRNVRIPGSEVAFLRTEIEDDLR